MWRSIHADQLPANVVAVSTVFGQAENAENRQYPCALKKGRLFLRFQISVLVCFIQIREPLCARICCCNTRLKLGQLHPAIFKAVGEEAAQGLVEEIHSPGFGRAWRVSRWQNARRDRNNFPGLGFGNSFEVGAFVSCPIFLTQFWLFVAPGLYKREKTALAPFLAATPILFFLGGALVYYVLMPLAWRFFLSFETLGGEGTLPIELEAKVNEYLSLVMKLIFAFGLCFQLPVIMTLLARVGLATSKGMAEKRKYAVVLAFVAAAILTPPDVISQIGLALPTMVLYEISIVCVRMVEKGRGDVEEEDDDDDDDEEDKEEETSPGGETA